MILIPSSRDCARIRGGAVRVLLSGQRVLIGGWSETVMVQAFGGRGGGATLTPAGFESSSGASTADRLPHKQLAVEASCKHWGKLVTQEAISGQNIPTGQGLWQPAGRDFPCAPQARCAAAAEAPAGPAGAGATGQRTRAASTKSAARRWWRSKILMHRNYHRTFR